MTSLYDLAIQEMHASLRRFGGAPSTEVKAPNYPCFDHPYTGIRTVYVPCEWAEVAIDRGNDDWIDAMPSEAIIKAATLQILEAHQAELEALVIDMMKGRKA